MPDVRGFVRWSDERDGWLWSVVRGSELLADGFEPHESDAWTHVDGVLTREQASAPAH